MVTNISAVQTKPRKGDVIYAKRRLYRHYGIYIGHNKVIHFKHWRIPGQRKILVEETPYSVFTKGDPVYVCQFPHKADIYSPRETIKRAKSRLGKTGYNIVTNNCEHFAFWCKTGKHKSDQVEDICETLFGSRFKLDEVINEKSEKILGSVCDFLNRIADKLEDFAVSLPG